MPDTSNCGPAGAPPIPVPKMLTISPGAMAPGVAEAELTIADMTGGEALVGVTVRVMGMVREPVVQSMVRDA